MLDGWMDVGWLEKAELKPTQPSLAGAWQKSQESVHKGIKGQGALKF